MSSAGVTIESVDIDFWKSVLRRRWPESVVIGLTCVAVALALAIGLQPTFRAVCKILVQSAQIPDALARSTVTNGAGEQLEIFQQQTLTRENLLDLARRHGVYDATPNATPSDIVDDMSKRTDFVRIPFDLAPGNVAASVISISFDAPSAVLAADVANDIARRIVDDSTHQRINQATDTLEFFQKRADDLHTQLVDAEKNLLEFKVKNRAALPDSVEFRRTQQRDLQARIVQIQREESDLRQRRLALVSDFQNVASFTVGATLSPDEQLLAELKKTFVEQQLVYAPDSPNIKQLKRRIAAQEDVVRALRLRGTGSGQAPSIFDLQLKEIDTRLAQIADEKSAIDASLKELTDSLLATPANETALNTLERNYQTAQQLYTAMISKLAEATTGAEIEAGSKGVRFSIIEAATPPQKPASSRRLLIAVAGLIVGVFLGLGYPVLSESLKKGIRAPADLERGLNIAPLATVPFVEAPHDRSVRRMRLIAAAVIGIVVLPSAIVSYSHYGPTVRAAVSGFLKSRAVQ
jgi:uncharacterized protein involved in exopolysaccharide biosynthesis